MSKYKLLAADMDGTALNSKKELSPRTVAAMEKAIAEGYHVLFSTGRGISFVSPYIEQVKGMRYVISASGAEVLDVAEGRCLYKESIDPETVKYIFAAANGHYCLPVIYMNGESYGTEWTIDCADDFGLRAFESIYRQAMILTPDAFQYFMENPQPVEKINLFYAGTDDVPEILAQIKELPVRFTSITPTSLEINASGISKAKGIEALCKELGIELSEVIAVGDSMNDMEMLSVAGLKVAMGNANEEVKALCDLVCDDCDNDGVAKIIEEYLLA